MWAVGCLCGHNVVVRRVVILGRGGAGKSTLAVALGARTGLPVVELDSVFWRAGLTPTPADEWRRVQRELVARDAWILDGDLGPYDALDVRLARADTVVLLDFGLARCAWRALRRSRENLDFWRWLITYRRRERPRLLTAIREHAPGATLRVLRDPHAVAEFLSYG